MSLKEPEKSFENICQSACVPIAFLVLPNFQSCCYDLEHIFLFFLNKKDVFTGWKLGELISLSFGMNVLDQF